MNFPLMILGIVIMLMCIVCGFAASAHMFGGRVAGGCLLTIVGLALFVLAWHTFMKGLEFRP